MFDDRVSFDVLVDNMEPCVCGGRATLKAVLVAPNDCRFVALCPRCGFATTPYVEPAHAAYVWDCYCSEKADMAEWLTPRMIGGKIER